MEKYLKHAIIVLILFSLAAKFYFIFINEGMWWDEAVYLQLGKNIQKGYYSLDQSKAIETFRPPLLPLLISPFSNDVTIARLFVALVSIFSVISVYVLCKQLFGKDTALWASLFVSTNQLFVFFSIKVLTEPMFIALFCISLLFLTKGQKKRANFFFAGMFAGLALLTRYLGTLLIAACMLYFLFLFLKSKEKKGKEKTDIAKKAMFYIFGLLLALSPWLAASHFYYGNLLGSYLTNFAVYAEELPAYNFLGNLSGTAEILGFQAVFMLAGLCLFAARAKKNEARNILLLALFILPMAFVLLMPYAEPRYLLSYLAVYAIFAGFVLKHESKYARYLRAAALVACLFCAFSGFAIAWKDRDSSSGLAEASLFLKGMTSENDAIMSESYPYVYYLSGRRAFVFPKNESDVPGYVRENEIKYVLLYKFEPKNPAYTQYYFESNAIFERVKSFGQWGDENAAVIYRVRI